MTAETLPNITKTFKFSFPTCTNEEVFFNLEVPVVIPLDGSPRELVQRVINMFHIPVYLEDGKRVWECTLPLILNSLPKDFITKIIEHSSKKQLKKTMKHYFTVEKYGGGVYSHPLDDEDGELNEKLEQFVAVETQSFHNERDQLLLDQLKNNELDVDGIVKGWEKTFKESVVAYSDRLGTPDCEVFAAAHQRLASSPALHDMLQRETEYARAVADLIRNRDHDIETMVQSQTEEMDNLVRSLGSETSEADINALAAAQWTASSVCRARWASAKDALCGSQRSDQRRWVMARLHDHLADTSSPPALQTAAPPLPLPPAPPPSPRLEESFTIHLGSQLKHTHNLRICAMDLLDLARLNPDNPAEWSRRMQTSLSLYSSGLSAMVLLTDCQPTDYQPTGGSGVTAQLVAAASASTDHHFPDVEEQLKDVKEKVIEPAQHRSRCRLERSSSVCASAQAPTRPSRSSRPSRASLQPGDVFLTRHSNLADVHVVFHLMVDDTLRGDISSRHPVILGLRSILRACSAHDVTTLHIPLLLTHELTEEMTMSWCLRRAELVLKCVKGFALETAGAGGAELATLALSLPPHTASHVFAALAALTPAIFRLSNPVKAKASPA